MTVTALRTVTVSKPKSAAVKGERAKSRALAKRIKRQSIAATCIGIVSLVILGMSLKHQAIGICAMIGADAWEGWCMAVAIDAGFIALEMSLIFASAPGIRKEIAVYAKPAIVGTMMASAMMNAFAFSQHVTGYALIPAIAFGVAIPAMLYCLTRIGAALYINGSR